MSTRSERVTITLPSGESMNAYVARPEGSDRLPAVIVWMEIFGVNSHIRDVTDRVAAEGYVAIAPDFFHRTGPGIELGYDDAGMGEGMGHLNKLKADEMVADARAAVDYLRGREDVDGTKIGAMGFCIGGHMTYLTACECDIQAAASYYGGGIAAPQGLGGGPSTVSRTPKIKGRINCYFGAKDALIPQAQVETIRKAITDAGVDGQVFIYDEADHGFNCDQRPTWHEPSAVDAWQKTFKLFGETLKG